MKEQNPGMFESERDENVFECISQGYKKRAFRAMVGFLKNYFVKERKQ